jgi:tetratricopeptide (TPR) repeat protein
MELRPPPQPATPAKTDALTRILLLAVLVTLLALGVLLLKKPVRNAAGDPTRWREVAGKLKAAGALDEAAAQFERYLASGQGDASARASIAYSLGTTYLDRGQYEKALRWFYEAESLGGGELQGEIAQKIVHSLERLGRHHAAQAALSSRTRLDQGGASGAPVERSEADPVVARIGQDEIRRSDLDRMLDEMPPELARSLADPSRREELLKQAVADELLWRKAAKLEYDNDPQVRRAHARLLRQLAVSKFVEREVVSKIAVDEADLRNHFEANKARFQPPPAEGGEAPPVRFEDVRAAVERDYRQFKIQAAYQELIDSELATEDVQLFPERLKDAG